MKYFDWSELKNVRLKAERDVCFEDVLIALDTGKLLDDIVHPDQKSYQGQRIFVVELDDYAFLVPCVEDTEKIFLKTIYPSRKFTSKYLSKRRPK